jgi:hypothetical protein
MATISDEQIEHAVAAHQVAGQSIEFIREACDAVDACQFCSALFIAAHLIGSIERNGNEEQKRKLWLMVDMIRSGDVPSTMREYMN